METAEALMNNERFDVGADELALVMLYAHGRMSDEQLFSRLSDLRWPADDAWLFAGYCRRQMPTARRRPPGYRGPLYAD